MDSSSTSTSPKIQCVIVIYKSTFEESSTLSSLKRILTVQPAYAKELSILVYDNSPNSQEQFLNIITSTLSVEYKHDPTNGGLVAAYNVALDLAQQKGIKWLLLLDQDTEITGDLLPVLMKEIDQNLDVNVCALVPQQTREGKILSPTYRDRPVKSGLSSERLIVFNSAATLSVPALNAIGGFPVEFRLDYLDHIVFHRLQSRGGRVLVLPISLEHQLSIMNLEAEMSVQRYTNLLIAEWAYIREIRPRGFTIPHRIRLMNRSFNQLKMSNKKYALQTLRAVFSFSPRELIT